VGRRRRNRSISACVAAIRPSVEPHALYTYAVWREAAAVTIASQFLHSLAVCMPNASSTSRAFLSNASGVVGVAAAARSAWLDVHQLETLAVVISG
jgi:hypothetical protein